MAATAPTATDSILRDHLPWQTKRPQAEGSLGAWDFVTIVEAPDNETAAHLAIDLGSRGTVNIQTLPALSLIDLRKVMKGPKQMGKK